MYYSQELYVVDTVVWLRAPDDLTDSITVTHFIHDFAMNPYESPGFRLSFVLFCSFLAFFYHVYRHLLKHDQFGCLDFLCM